MARYVAFLRAINVGGRRVTGDVLRACFADMSFVDVATFRASGNVIFSASDGERVRDIARRIEEGLTRSLGYDVAVFARTRDQMRAIAAHQPFAPAVVGASRGKLQVLLLSAPPATQPRKDVLALATDEDRLAIRGCELYWLPSGGILESGLDFKLIETRLGSATTRTKGTIDQIAAKYFAG